jgi:surfeit locus 1 family protein
LLTGKWDISHSMLLGPRVRDGTSGFHVVTPLVRKDGSTILVDRGFISNECVRHATQRAEDENEVEVIGVLRTSQARSAFTPDNNPQKNEWHWADVDAMSRYAGGEQTGVQPVYVEEIFGAPNTFLCSSDRANSCTDGHAGNAATRISNGIPIGRPPTVDLRNAHMSYVITWWGVHYQLGLPISYSVISTGILYLLSRQSCSPVFCSTKDVPSLGAFHVEITWYQSTLAS